MSLAAAAHHIASKGRHGDTTLVHMAPQELAGLHALARAHGKKITTNPDTGLPEAFSLKSLLPMLAGAALSFVPGVGPLMAAGIVGGGTTLATGSLNKGLMAGLGAYGGAGLTGGLMAAGASQMPTVATDAILNANPGQIAASGTMQPAITGSEIAREMGSLSPATGTFQPAAGFVQPELGANANQVMGSGMDKLSTGFKGLSTDAGQKAFLQGVGGGGKALTYGMAAATPSLMETPKQAPYDGGGPNPYSYEYNANPTGATPGTAPEPYYFRPQYRRLADGGLAALAEGGASHLGDYSDGGRLLKGPGDGVSDSIPATIADKRPARLADGEFVVPARIVSEIGNGSTEAGARKLYAMMDRVQQARGKTVGKGKVAVNSRAEKLLPA